MGSKVSYTIVGIFVIVLAAVLFAFFFWLSAVKHDVVYHTYLVYVQEDVTGLNSQSAVRYNGVPVGYVSNIDIDRSNPSLVKLTLKIKQGTPITTGTVATLIPQGITGVIYVGLKIDVPNAPLLKAKAGQKYPIIPAKLSILVQLTNVLPEITKNIKRISDSFAKVFDVQNRQAIANSLQNISIFSQSLSKNSKNLDQIMASLKSTLNETSKAGKKLPQTMQRLDDSLKTIRIAAKKVGDASQVIQGTMQHGTVAVNNFSNQLIPQAQITLQHLNGVATNLMSVTQELKQNPAILLRGKQPAAPGPGEVKQ